MGEIWRYPCLFGGFVGNVLDRGLAGFWGGWWHQSFRVGFTGPIRWLVKMGVLGEVNGDGAGEVAGETAGGTAGGKHTGMNGKQTGMNGKEKKKTTQKKKKKMAVAMAEMATAFFMSGVLHALGGWTSTSFRISPSPSNPNRSEDLLTGDTRSRLPVFFEPVGFFVSQFLGCVLQAFLVVLLRTLLTKATGQKNMWEEEMPRWLKRTGNGLFVLSWGILTRWMLIDDMARSGLFLFEPVPISVFRLLGLGGLPGEGPKDWWRLDGEYLPSWWTGGGKGTGMGRWWEWGVRI